MNYVYRGLAVAGITLLSAAGAWARPPQWAQSLLAEDVAELGQGYMSVRLADTCTVRYTADQHVHRTYHGAIRILTQNGRSRARCSYGYNADTERVTAARAWLIGADGKEVASYAISDFLDAALRMNGIFWPQQRTLLLSESEKVEVKGALVWEIEVESQVSMDDLTWSFPDDMPTVFCALDVEAPPTGKLAWHASNGNVPLPSPGPTPGTLHWEEVKRRPRSGGEHPANFLPTPRSVAIRVVDPKSEGHEQSWSDLAKVTRDIMEPRIAAISPELSAKAAMLVAGKTKRWERVRALCNFAQKEITYLAVILDKDCLAGYRPHAADEVLKSRYGDCKDKTTLLIALLRAIGDNGDPMLVFSGNPTAVLPDWPSPRFNHVITCIRADDDVPTNWPVIDGGPLGRVVLFDPTNPFTPLGLLPREDQGGHGLIVAMHSPGLVPLPSGADELHSDIRMTVDELGDVTAKVVEMAAGNIAAEVHARRDADGNEKFKASLEARLHESVVHLDGLTWTDAWAPEKGRYELTLDFVAHRYARRAGSLMLVSPHLLISRERPTPWKTYHDGVVPGSTATLHRTVRIALPTGAVVEELPDAWQAEAPHATAKLTYRRDGNEIVYESEVTTAAAFLDKPSYEAQRAWSQKIEDAERRPIVLRVPQKQ
jgi:hypothetical protein